MNFNQYSYGTPFKLILIGLLILTGCSTVNKNLETSNTIPEANGQIKAKPSKDGNTHLEVTVKHLATPGKIRQGATEYVAWVRPGEGTQAIPQNIGVVKINQELEGSLNTLTPLKNFNFFITAEHSTQVATPSGVELMWANFPTGDL